MKKYRTPALVFLFTLIVLTIFGLLLAGKTDVVWFSMTHPSEARFAMERYNALHSVADKQYYDVLQHVK
jgi:hypothetical protein